MSRIAIYDTTLRDGVQAEEFKLSGPDKLRVAQKLDTLGVDYIEGGWPGSNPVDKAFFKEVRGLSLKHSKIAAFGSTHNAKHTPETDSNLRTLIESKAPVATIVGKSWDDNVRDGLRIDPERNLELIANSIAYLRPHFQELFLDAEHYFDGFRANPDYAIACLKAAMDAGADGVVLCDTNGGCMTYDLGQIVARTRELLPKAMLGIHVHNDAGLAVANSLEAVRCGATQVQGTINGYGERCGNANLCEIIPNLELKMCLPCLPEGNLSLLKETSVYISEVANLVPFARMPYVGESAFAHKGGLHVSAIARNSRTYEHVCPDLVGNKQRVLLSDMAGQSNILFKAKEYGITLDKNDPFVLELLTLLKERESQGYEYSAAEASFELLMLGVLGRTRRFFTLVKYRVLDWKQVDCEAPLAEGTIMIKVGGREEHTAATGRGPINALDTALRKALTSFYPRISEMRLTDFKVRVLTAKNKHEASTGATVRVLLESTDAKRRWTTVGVSGNIIEASWQALEDAVNYKLTMDERDRQLEAAQASQG